MSTNYTCNQFDKAYIPTRLGNWEVPKWHLNRPKGRSTVTKFVANDRGHLLPGVQKTDQKHWAGLYLGTYQLPKRITKEMALELSSPKKQTWMRRSYHHPFIDRGEKNNNENDRLENTNDKEQHATNEETDRNSIKSVKSVISNPHAAAPTSDDAIRNRAPTDGHDDCSGGGDGEATFAQTPSSPALSRISAGDDAPAVAEHRNTASGRRYGDAHRHHGLPDAIEDAVYRSLQNKRDKRPGLGLNCWPKCSAVAYKSFNDPGPTQCSKLRVYRPKTSSSSSSAAAGDAGRDGQRIDSVRRRGDGKDSRPKTCVPVVTAERLTDIKLALCWDLDAPFDRNRGPRSPDRPAVFHKVQQQQPKPRDQEVGERKPQNSSAVMGFVRTDAPAAGNGVGGNEDDDELQRARRSQPTARECLLKNRNLSAVMELIPNEDRDDGRGRQASTAAAERNDDALAAAADRTLSDKSTSPSSARRGKSAGNDNDDRDDHGRRDDRCGESDDDRGRDDALPRRRRRRRSSADFSSDRRRHRRDAVAEKETKNSQRSQRHVFRPCLACDRPVAVVAATNRRDREDCDHYKMAFKAGVPVSTPVRNRTAAAGKPAKHLKVPKPKTTNSDKKKYVIGTLLPPFSMWPGTTARDYPEHWRLTSVYRQAFKPLELRKQPLLQTVYL